ncbi:probable purine permease 10 isoform X1 [Ziziphus jujuba]|uniref:Probable purine permease n=3 Tax=Ziziphus jujuba TaxID=326968 RepID=A0A6P3ZTI1_ZIZJJ|nr:probable purine permease 10 isoform X1 [Ziziphus jujuba]
MAEAQKLQLSIMAQEALDANSPVNINVSNQSETQRRKFWFRMTIYTFFLLSGQSVATLLGRLYFDKGGKSKWMGTIVQLIGFPIFLPYYTTPAYKNSASNRIHSKHPSALILVAVYVVLGLLVAANSYMYSVGLQYLPVSTYSLICASQLAFNAFFSYFFNSQKFTPYVVNSLVLLTISSILLVFQTESTDPSKVSKVKYAIGFICTIGASAGYGLVLSLTQFSIQRILKRETFSVVIDMTVYQSLVATCATLVGLFASGEWKGLTKEMNEFELGKVSYVMTLTWTAIGWQVFSIGAVGLIIEVSSLFSNVISVLGLPIIPVLAVIFFHEKMGGVKAISLVLAIWGFISYVYQQYLDHNKSKIENENDKAESELL